MNIEIVKEPMPLARLEAIARNQFGDLVKAVADLDLEIMAIGGDLHADGEALLMEQGSEQKNLWGINLYPGKKGDDFVGFDSMINLRPSQGNLSRSVEDAATREKILKVVRKLVNQQTSKPVN